MLLARCESSSSYEAKVVSPEQMMVILNELDQPTTRLEWNLALLHAATALRPEECFGLQWRDWDKRLIHIRRGWSKGKLTEGKNENSMTQVVLTPIRRLCQPIRPLYSAGMDASRNGCWAQIIFAHVEDDRGIRPFSFMEGEIQSDSFE